MNGFARLRRREFARLDRENHAYLDYTGSALYATSQVRAHTQFLTASVLGNPHSENPASLASTRWVERARTDVLAFFHADPAEYDVIFTANASAAIKLVGESYAFGPGSALVATADNHNSVNGLRCYAERAGAAVHTVPLTPQLLAHDPREWLARASGGLFAFPAQSNFSGVKHPLSWVGVARDAGYDVLLDAAAFVPANPLRLDRVRPDFVSLSFYKMFGYPTGVGALIARRAALARLRRPWFAGGTVLVVSVQHGMHHLRAGVEAFEDGTPDFLAISAVPAGLRLLERIGMDNIQRRIERLTARLIAGLTALRHADGSPRIRIYGPLDTTSRGGTVAFNVLAGDGSIIPYGSIEAHAAAAGVSVRGGCFCNPGAAERALDIPPARALECLRAVESDSTIADFAHCMGDVPVGAVRASVGIATMPRDLDRLIHALAVTPSPGRLPVSV
jgi:selenocysteine lyase/cysteine desulfurase